MTSRSLSDYPSRGELRDISIPVLLAILGREEFTGTLLASVQTVEESDDTEITREIQFVDGHIAWGISTEPDESLRAFLIRSGSLSQEQWDEAEEQARQETLRETLIELGFVDRDELTTKEKGRVNEIIHALFDMQGGQYRLRERPLSPGTPDLEISVAPLVVETISEWGDKALMQEEIGSLDSIYRATADVSVEWIGRRGEFKTILELMDGTRSVGQICATTSLPDTFVGSVVAGLSLVGLAERVGQQKRTASVAPPVPADAEFIPVASRREEEREETLSMNDYDEDGEETLDAVEEVPVSALGEPRDRTGDLFSPPTEGEEGSVSLYDDEGVPEASRPWFLLGGAAAVGFAALFLVLMAQGRGDAVGLSGAPGSEIADLAPAGDQPLEETEVENSAEIPEQDRMTEPDPSDEADESLPDPIDQKTPVSPPVAQPPPTTDSDRGLPYAERGQTSLSSGDFAMAARHFGRHVSSHPGDFTIQIAMACEDGTVGKLVEQASRGSDLFILATRYKGRDCYRVYWGQYRTEQMAREALQRDVPASLRSGSTKPWVTRLPS